MTHDFRQDYEALELDHGADWATARTAYRRQVNLWHPDRYTQQPRERVHAQQRFIQLTRAFDSLRNFYRTNRRLPFEPIGAERRNAAATGAGEPPLESGTDAGRRRRAASPSEEEVLEAGILTLRAPTGRPRRSGLGRLLWPALAAALVLATLAVFLVLDRSARQATMAEGREVLRRTEPSEFMPSAAEVQKRSSRGTFVEREDSGRIGDQLMEDMFR